MINLKQSDFCTTYSIQILVSEGKCKNDHESQKKKKKKKNPEKKQTKQKQKKPQHVLQQNPVVYATF